MFIKSNEVVMDNLNLTMESKPKKQKLIGIKSFFKPSTSVTTTPTHSRDNSLVVSASSTNARTNETETKSTNPYQPNDSFPFPKTSFGKQQRSCQSQWFKEFKWLDYDEKNDHVTCFICKRQKLNLEPEKNKEDTFLKMGFRNWKKALSTFNDHQKSKCHSAALTHEITVPLCGNVREMTNQAVADNMALNRRCFMKVLQNLQFLSHQGLAFRGDESDENSNFIQLLKLRSNDVPELLDWLKKKTNRFTSHDVQNEIIMLMTHEIIRDISKNIQTTYYSIICDEYTDISNKEQLTLCLRWVDQFLTIREEFIGFYEIQNIKSDTIVSAIKDILLRIQLSLESCRGQCYDGASNMLGKRSGRKQHAW